MITTHSGSRWSRAALALGIASILGCGGEDGQGTPDGAVEPQADAAAVGDPIEAPLEAWTFVPFDDAFCANGSTTGIGVNLADDRSNVMIFLQGGGACWDNLTCYVLMTAANLVSGYDEADFQDDAAGILQSSLFDRADPNNPVRDWSFVFVPYCTGDVHSGSNTALHGSTETMHVGYDNLTAYLERIADTFPSADRVVLSGSSAGGFGAGFNYARVQDLFGATRVDLLDDSGPPLPPPYLSESLEQQWRTAWGLDRVLPAGCTACADDLTAILDYIFANYPVGRKALLSYTRDNVISAFLQISGAQVAEGLGVLADTVFDQADKARYFYVDGSQHVLLSNPSGVSQNGVVLMDWLRQMLTDDPAWANVRP